MGIESEFEVDEEYHQTNLLYWKEVQHVYWEWDKWVVTLVEKETAFHRKSHL